MTKSTEQQLDLIKKGSQHGGAREGAGRKKKRETKVMRIPKEYAELVQGLIEYLDSTGDIKAHPEKIVKSDPIFYRAKSGSGSRQWLKFVTTSKKGD